VRYELTRRMCVERRIRIANSNDIAAGINDTTAHGERFRSRSRGNRSAAGRVVEERRQGQKQQALSRTRLVQAQLRLVVQDDLAAQNLAACRVDDYHPVSNGHGVVRPVCVEDFIEIMLPQETELQIIRRSIEYIG
jgi:hypothetical protein